MYLVLFSRFLFLRQCSTGKIKVTALSYVLEGGENERSTTKRMTDTVFGTELTETDHNNKISDQI